MRVLIAFDKFKDSLTAPAACRLAAEALRDVRPEWEVECSPLADGGEGFAGILTEAACGQTIAVDVEGPRGRRQGAYFGVAGADRIPAAAAAILGLPAGTRTVAVVEMAVASGLALLPLDERDPWRTSSVGTGQLLRRAADRGVDAVLLGVGGSATHDLGLGALTEWGLRCLDATGSPVDPRPENWERIVRVERAPGMEFPHIRIACDVSNPLLGPRGAAAVYGPQKGLAGSDLARLERETARLARLLTASGPGADLTGVPGAGAAGGIAFGLMTVAGARLVPGFELVSAWLDLAPRIQRADLVITGEGSFDASSLEGKGPGAVAAQAMAVGKAVQVFAGRVTASPRPGLNLEAITPAGMPLAQALREAPENLAAAVRRVFSAPR
jgi:glycerate 2-kinase